MPVVRLETYVENLVRMTIECEAGGPPSVVIWPQVYRPALEDCGGAWEL